MKHQFIFCCAVFVSLLSTAQTDCSNGRYSDHFFFTSVDTDPGVYFGENTAVAGGNETLEMDVYMPLGDTATARPVVIIGFGGSFIAGTRQDVAWLCEEFAKLGYVAIAPDYRIGFFLPTEYTTMLAVTRAMHDMKACVRFLKKTVAEDGNPYGIDPERIIVGGISAGAIGAIHATYLNDNAEIPSVLWGDTATFGGVEGNSGTPGYSSSVAACFSFSGAIGDTTWINAGDPPLASVHEVGDQTVPYATQEVNVLGLPTGLEASGSLDIHKRMSNQVIPNCLLTYPGSGHIGYLGSDLFNSTEMVVQFCKQVVCNEPVGCGMIFSGVEDIDDDFSLSMHPNPANELITVQTDKATEILVSDLSGRLVFSQFLQKGATSVDISELPAGMYQLLDKAGGFHSAFIKN